MRKALAKRNNNYRTGLIKIEDAEWSWIWIFELTGKKGVKRAFHGREIRKNNLLE